MRTASVKLRILAALLVGGALLGACASHDDGPRYRAPNYYPAHYGEAYQQHGPVNYYGQQSYNTVYQPGTYIRLSQSTQLMHNYQSYSLPAPSYGYSYVRSGGYAYLCQPYQGHYIVHQAYPVGY